MNRLDKICFVIIVVIFSALYACWYRYNASVVAYCMDNIEVCEAQYYGK